MYNICRNVMHELSVVGSLGFWESSRVRRKFQDFMTICFMQRKKNVSLKIQPLPMELHMVISTRDMLTFTAFFFNLVRDINSLF